ncbi:MAG: hypothetical protein ACRYGA_14300 [Janthinobacterium lividum]
MPVAAGGGRLEWQIAVRDDGQRLFYGALLSLEATHPRIETLRMALDAIGFDSMALRQGAPDFVARLRMPRDIVTLGSRITSYS